MSRKDSIKRKKGSRAGREPMMIRKTKELDTENKIKFFKEVANKNVEFSRLDSFKYKEQRETKNLLTSKICYICGGNAYCMHHIVPLICGGKNRKRNLIPICIECHRKIHPFMSTNGR